MTGLGGLTAFIFITSMYMEVNLLLFLILSIAASGIAASSRLHLSAHTPAEVVAGFVMGSTVMTGCLILY